jgi:hypothetical protein
MKEIQQEIRDNVRSKGVVTVNVLEPKTNRDTLLVEQLRKNIAALSTAGRGMRHKLYARNARINEMLESSCMVKRYIQDNIVCKAGLTQMTKGFSDNLTTLSEMAVNYAGVGDSATTPTATDTTLTNETFRNVINTLNYADNVLYASMFIDFLEDSGTYKEAALFVNGTASVDTGSILDHVLLNAPTGIVKSTSQIFTVSFQITFSPV